MTEGHDDDTPGAKPSAKPGDWSELVYRVGEEAFVKVFNPSNPLVKIGRFDALAMIGEGGFGIVFKARDPDLDRLVALKLCRTRSQSAIDRLIGEAKVLAQLAHPNIVTIHERGDHDGGVFFAMQYIPENAERFAAREPPPSWQEVVDVYRGVASGLAAAHGHAVPIIHGDVKPSNILIDSDDLPRIADFGLARRVIDDADESEQEGLRHRAGTLYYMAPEALRGEPSNALTDQFSFFVSLWQTLTGGALPFHGRTSAEVLRNIEHTDVMKLLDPSLPAELRDAIQRGLSLDPRDRFPDMRTVLAVLDRVRQSPPPSSPPPDGPESDDPGSELDGPEQMPLGGGPEQPESSEVMPVGGSEQATPEQSPTVELEPELNPPLDEPELVPLGSGPAPSKAKRGVVSVSLVLAVGLTLGWLGRGRVEGPRPSEPVPLPSSPCALGDEQGVSAEIDPVVLAVCTYIRRGQIDDANQTWESVYRSRWAEIESLTVATFDPAAPATVDPAEAADKLAADTMIIVQTAQDWAKLSVGPEVAKANDLARLWTVEAEWTWAKATKIREKKSGRAEQPAPK